MEADLGGVVDKLVPFIDDVLAVTDSKNIQFTKHCRELDRRLMCDDMPDLMAQQRGKLVFILCKSDHPAEDINASARGAERIQFRCVHNKEAIVHFRGRKLRQYPLAQFLQVPVRVFDHMKLFPETLVNSLSQPFFLLVTKN